MQDTWFLSLDGEDPLEKEMATRFSISCLKNSMNKVWQAAVCEVTKN